MRVIRLALVVLAITACPILAQSVDEARFDVVSIKPNPTATDS